MAEARGRQPDRLVQGPGHDLRGVGRGARGREGGGLRLDRQHRRLGRGLRGAGRAARRGDRARGQDRHRQAGPGADARRPRGRAARQLRRGAGARPRAGQAPPDLARQLGQRVPDRGPEDGRVRDGRGARRRARRALHPGRQRGQHHRLLARASARSAVQSADARLPGRRRRAARPRGTGRAPRDGRQRDPDRQSRALGGGDGRDDRPRAARSRRSPTSRSSTPTASSPPRRACSASRPRPRASPVCWPTASRDARRVVCVLTGHGLKDPQTALGQAGAVVPCEPELAAIERAVLE